MLWVDVDTYVGLCRRGEQRYRFFHERRRSDASDQPPSLAVAVRQLRFRAIDARGPHLAPFLARARAVAKLAHVQCDARTAAMLNGLVNMLERAGSRDVREQAYASLDAISARLN